MQKKCNPDCDKEQLDKLVDEFIAKHGHEAVRDMYNIHRFVRNTIYANRFPVAIFYRRSLRILLDNEYYGMNAGSISERERIPKRTAHRFIKDFFEYKKRTKDSNNE